MRPDGSGMSRDERCAKHWGAAGLKMRHAQISRAKADYWQYQRDRDRGRRDSMTSSAYGVTREGQDHRKHKGSRAMVSSIAT